MSFEIEITKTFLVELARKVHGKGETSSFEITKTFLVELARKVQDKEETH